MLVNGLCKQMSMSFAMTSDSAESVRNIATLILLRSTVFFGCYCYNIRLYKVSLPAGSAAGSSTGIAFTHEQIFGFFAPQGRHVASINVKFGSEERTPLCQISL